MTKRLYKIEEGKMLDGVCGGVAEYFNSEPTVVRLIWAFAAASGGGVVAYLICALVFPKKSEVI